VVVDGLIELLEPFRGQRGEERGHAGEVTVGGAVGHPGLPCDGSQREPFQAVTLDDGPGRGHQLRR
jgi:hypothetical protein